mmetsp:Transcript_4030/g.7011  ORF Transcript_4030/g.7011 Transcript_4030/m.7011 type:complete len:212 (+) Transcript_4030:97-732(+)
MRVSPQLPNGNCDEVANTQPPPVTPLHCSIGNSQTPSLTNTATCFSRNCLQSFLAFLRCHVLEALVELHALDLFHVVALMADLPRRDGKRRAVVVVQPLGFQVRLERLGGFLGMVARHVREQVVRHVRAADVVVHPVERAVRAVNGAQRAPHPRPLVLPKVGQVGGRVLQPRVQHQPKVAPQVARPVHHRHLEVPELLPRQVQPHQRRHAP